MTVAVSVQLAAVVRLKEDAQAATASAETARHDACFKVELLHVELVCHPKQLSARDSELTTIRTEFRVSSAARARLPTTVNTLWHNPELCANALTQAPDVPAQVLAAIHARYEGLSLQLRQET